MGKRTTTSDEIHREIYIADTFLKRLTGYMFQKKPRYSYILITPCNSVHTVFMKFDIDVLFLDKNMKVIKILRELKPGRIVMPIKEAVTVIEAPGGSLYYFEIGDEVKII